MPYKIKKTEMLILILLESIRSEAIYSWKMDDYCSPEIIDDIISEIERDEVSTDYIQGRLVKEMSLIQGMWRYNTSLIFFEKVLKKILIIQKEIEHKDYYDYKFLFNLNEDLKFFCDKIIKDLSNLASKLDNPKYNFDLYFECQLQDIQKLMIIFIYKYETEFLGFFCDKKGKTISFMQCELEKKIKERIKIKSLVKNKENFQQYKNLIIAIGCKKYFWLDSQGIPNYIIELLIILEEILELKIKKTEWEKKHKEAISDVLSIVLYFYYSEWKEEINKLNVSNGMIPEIIELFNQVEPKDFPKELTDIYKNWKINCKELKGEEKDKKYKELVNAYIESEKEIKYLLEATYNALIESRLVMIYIEVWEK